MRRGLLARAPGPAPRGAGSVRPRRSLQAARSWCRGVSGRAGRGHVRAALGRVPGAGGPGDAPPPPRGRLCSLQLLGARGESGRGAGWGPRARGAERGRRERGPRWAPPGPRTLGPRSAERGSRRGGAGLGGAPGGAEGGVAPGALQVTRPGLGPQRPRDPGWGLASRGADAGSLVRQGLFSVSALPRVVTRLSV